MEAWIILLPYGARLLLEVDMEAALALLEVRTKQLTDLRPVLERIAAIMREELGARFADAGEGTWPPLATSTIVAKRLAGLPPLTRSGRIPRRLKQQGAFGPGGILIRTGALRDAYRQKYARGHVERIAEKEATVAVGANLPLSDGRNLAAIHQHGTPSYTIRARLAKALAFPGSSGETILRRAVQHPGLPARPVFVSRAGVERIVDALYDHLAGKEFVHAARS